ncbi:MAG: carbon-nitrogen hydrolase family protein [Proteobacteria bacterium]|nr:carbon-nitrogen hydrolase family protein [Pseudomonadota bacterium]
MRVTVCQLNDQRALFDADWQALCAHVKREKSDLVLLPEMPFSHWFATERVFDQKVWDAAIAAHAAWRPRLLELAPAMVLTAEPAERNGKRLNEAIIWDGGLAISAHQKRFLPEEEGFWEATWYERGDGAFDIAVTRDARVGFQICTELWMLEESRKYGLMGADIIAAPRCTPMSTVERWFIAGRAAAMLSGAFCLSSNHAGASHAGLTFGGAGWIIDPEGVVMAVTSASEPIVTREIDIEVSRAAKTTYPRYVS